MPAFAFLAAMVVRGVGAVRYAIVGVEIADRNAELPAIVDQRQAAACGPSLALGIVDLAALAGLCGQVRRFIEMPILDFMFGEVEQVAADARRIDEAAAAGVAGLAPAAIEVRDDLRAQSDVDGAADVAVVCRSRISADGVDMDMVGRHYARNPAVEQIDRSADRLAAEQQHGGAAENLDAFDGQRIDRHSMVGGRVRCIDRPDAVGQDADSLARKAAEYGARSTGGKAGCRHARLARQRVANLSSHVARQFVAFKYRHITKNVEATDIGRGDDDRLAGMHIVATTRRGAVLRKGGGGEDHGEGETD